jgi:hypothetical protein
MYNCLHAHKKSNEVHFVLFTKDPGFWDLWAIRISVSENVILFLTIYLIKSCRYVIKIFQDFIEISQYIKCFLSTGNLCVSNTIPSVPHVIVSDSPMF